jgi:hypothetical protein
MLTQQITQRMQDNSGQLVIVAEPGNLAELVGLASELDLRMNITTNGPITQLPEPEPSDG